MLQFLQIIMSIITLALLVPQTTKLNLLLRKFYESGVFANYSEAKRVLKRLTWGTIFLFFIVTYFAARS
jgi:hypothetical protein